MEDKIWLTLDMFWTMKKQIYFTTTESLFDALILGHHVCFFIKYILNYLKYKL